MFRTVMGVLYADSFCCFGHWQEKVTVDGEKHRSSRPKLCIHSMNAMLIISHRRPSKSLLYKTFGCAKRLRILDGRHDCQDHKGNAELVLSLDGLEGTGRGGSQVSISPLSIDCALFLLLVALTRYGRDSSRHSFP